MPLTVSPGDKIYTSTNYDSFVPLICSGVSASYGVHFYVQDMTSGASASAGLCTNNADESTAEWITERSGLCPNNNPNNCGLSQLAQFSPLAWKSTGVTDAAQSNTLASLTENPISFSMTSDGSSTGDILALPGTINSSGGFTDTWYACS